MEKNLKCSGFCTAQNAMMFSDVNSEVPTTACFANLRYWAHQNFTNYGIIAIVFGGFDLFAAGIACVLLFFRRKSSITPIATLDCKE